MRESEYAPAKNREVQFGKNKLTLCDRFNAIAFYLDIADMLAKEGL